MSRPLTRRIAPALILSVAAAAIGLLNKPADTPVAEPAVTAAASADAVTDRIAAEEPRRSPEIVTASVPDSQPEPQNASRPDSRRQVRVDAPYTSVRVDPDGGKVRVRAPFVNLDIRW